ncbi:hypothetical protein [Leuconostoc mesenteroides]|uniref:hypothetical protein n=1 Tax=Leuconostoc mesenteroides TaxID=1245 RepID=UPI002362DABF|nr:hypothetical protein [Leuconostoc mesenteroides]
MNMTVGDLQFSFVGGKLTLKYASVSFNAGTFPNSLNGNLQVTPEDGVSMTSSEDDIKAAAKKKIQALIAEVPAKKTEV